MAPHVLQLDVRFGECDPAGVVYYPRFFDWWHRGMEDWFGAVVGVPYATVLGTWKVGFPAVETHARYLRPCRFGERLDLQVRVGDIGRSSLVFEFAVVDPASGEVRATGHTKVVTVVLDPTDPRHFRPVPVPDELGAAAERSRAG